MTTLTHSALSLRVADVRAAAALYERIGFQHVMAVPDETGEWVLCLLRYGSASILLGAHDHPHFPRTSSERRVRSGSRGRGGTIDVAVPDLLVTYVACINAGCDITLEPAQEPWGDRVFSCLDPFGYEWHFVEKVSRPGVELLPSMARAALS